MLAAAWIVSLSLVAGPQGDCQSPPPAGMEPGACCDGALAAASCLGSSDPHRHHTLARLHERMKPFFEPHELGPCGRWGTLDVGGELRLRYHHERGMGQQAGFTRFEPTENDFLLTRLRLHGLWEANDWLRVYAEGLYADLGAEASYIPRPIDENDFDFQNLYADMELTDDLTLRIGRQELLYGNQRLVSPLDWANTRRTFEGVKFMLQWQEWQIDSFFTNFVPPDPGGFDRPEYDISLYGVYATKQIEDQQFELFYLGSDNQLPGAPGLSDYSLHTFGGRIFGEHDRWLYEAEGGGQFGRQSGLGVDHSASYFTLGLGRAILPAWEGKLWFYYDYASGDVPGGEFDRFNDLFPLAHKYLGFIDAVLRRNVQSPNVLFTAQPTEKLGVLLWYYHFLADEPSDIILSVGGTPDQRLDERHFGDELDLIITYEINDHSDILFGWSHLWPGAKIINPVDADFVYTQYSYEF